MHSFLHTNGYKYIDLTTPNQNSHSSKTTGPLTAKGRHLDTRHISKNTSKTRH